MANTVGRRSVSRYKEGQEVRGRILEVDTAKKRVSMTLKKLLCSDKLPIITTFKVRAAAACPSGHLGAFAAIPADRSAGILCFMCLVANTHSLVRLIDPFDRIWLAGFHWCFAFHGCHVTVDSCGHHLCSLLHSQRVQSLCMCPDTSSGFEQHANCQ